MEGIAGLDSIPAVEVHAKLMEFCTR